MRSTWIRHFPARAAAGAFILNSGLSKRGADEETAGRLHGMAKTAYPRLDQVASRDFVRMLSSTEIALGTALLLPVVPTAVAGVGLTAFSAGLVGLYLRLPGTRRQGSVRPTDQGVPLAKDVWMLGIGLSLIADSLVERARRR